MKRIKLLTVWLICSLLPAAVFAQGFTFDESQYDERETVEHLRGPVPTSVSLKRYTPIIYPQENSNCVAQSFANAMTILLAKSAGITDKDVITLLRPSPFFIYYSNRLRTDINCDKGLDAEKTAINLLNMGVVPMMSVEFPNYYPFTGNVLCRTYPPVYQNDVTEARNLRPGNIYKVSSLMDIKVALANGMPVVIGMMVPESFANVNSYVWSPSAKDNINNSYGHAMTVVGYDDNLFGGSFEIMNSWGEDWGVNGYTRVRYRDAINWIIAGWAVERETTTRYRYEGDFKSQDDELATPESEMVRIFSEARQDTLMVNPFFQQTDLLDRFREFGE